MDRERNVAQDEEQDHPPAGPQDRPTPSPGAATSRVDDASIAGAAAVLEHERIPFVSYPYEWTFSMLRDAALLQLELLRRALDEDLMLKDSSSYNVQWNGARPVFIDVGSFERLRPGEPWAGYRQFCMLFLYPLLLKAYRGVPFQPLLRGSLDGIEPAFETPGPAGDPPPARGRAACP